MATETAVKTQPIIVKVLAVTCFYQPRGYQSRYDELIKENNVGTTWEEDYIVEAYEFPNGTVGNSCSASADWFFESMGKFVPDGTDILRSWEYTGDTCEWQPKDLIKSAFESKRAFGDDPAIDKVLELVSPMERVKFHLERLELDTDTDPCSGLMAEEALEGIKLYDDHADGVYNADQLVKILEGLDEVTLESDDPNNIWGLIKPAAI